MVDFSFFSKLTLHTKRPVVSLAGGPLRTNRLSVWEAGIGTKSVGLFVRVQSEKVCNGLYRNPALTNIFQSSLAADWELFQEALAGTSMYFLPFSNDSSSLF